MGKGALVVGNQGDLPDTKSTSRDSIISQRCVSGALLLGIGEEHATFPVLSVPRRPKWRETG